MRNFMNMRLILRFLSLVTFFLFSQFGFSQNVLKLYSKANYHERNLFSYDSTLHISCAVCYNDPNVIDEEFCYQLDLEVKNCSKKSLPVVIQLADSVNVKSEFDLVSVWNWSKENAIISGDVKIISLTESELKLELNILVVDLIRNRQYLYAGERIFLQPLSVPAPAKNQ
jgi:hypothetical protein